MYLTHLSLTNFRSFTRLDLEIPPKRVVLMIGGNAQGKTSILEAIYYLATFTSFQTHTDRQLINFIAAKENPAVGRLIAEYQRGVSAHRLEVRLILEPFGKNSRKLRKEILLDGVKRPMVDLIGHFSAVIFVPQMSHIIEGGPEQRRRYLNLALAQSTTVYAGWLTEYSRALEQRNALLKLLNERKSNHEQLAIWDETLAHIGSQIILARVQAVKEIENNATHIYRELTRDKEILRIHYMPSYDPLLRPQGQILLPLDTPVDRSDLTEENIHQGFIQQLKQLRREEIARGLTLIGPHRDELRFLVNGIDLSCYGSRGQVRTALLALKLAEVDWLKEKTGQWPVLLLDEVLAELDNQHRVDLLAYINQIEQALLTTADLQLYTPGFINKVELWEVKAGSVYRQKSSSRKQSE